MRPRTLLTLFLVVAGMAAFIWFVERDLPSTQERREQERKLVVLDPAQVEGLELKVAGQTVRLQRDRRDDETEAEWRLAEPPRGRADADEVEDLLARIGDLEKERTIDDGSREALGLTAPRAEIEVGTGAGKLVLRFGSKVPASENTVVEVDTGPPFFIVRDSLFEDIARVPDDWRSREAVPVDRSRVQRIDILVPESGVSLERDGDDFRLVEPIRDDAEAARVTALVDGLIDLEIDQFLDEPNTAPELAAPAASVRLTIEGKAEPMTVSIAAAAAPGTDADPASQADPPVAVRVDGQAFLAKTDLASQIAASAREWQSTKWTSWRSFEIEGVRVDDGEEEIVLDRSEGKWLREGEEISYSKVDGFLRAITGAKGVPVNEGETAESEPNSTALEIVLASSEGEERLRFLGEGRGRLAERDGRDVRLRLEEASATELLAKLQELKVSPAAEETTTDGPVEEVDR